MKKIVVLLFIVIAALATAQNFSIDWFTIDGGGGTSTGGGYSVSGTIGQPDAGTLAGGSYTLVGGFWGLVEAIQTPGAPLLSISYNMATDAVTVSWTRPADGWVLDETSALALPWSQVAFPYQTNATHISVTVPSSVGNHFYRLRK